MRVYYYYNFINNLFFPPQILCAVKNKFKNTEIISTEKKISKFN